jgi:tRNA (uracil-5-)-methyltransferase
LPVDINLSYQQQLEAKTERLRTLLAPFNAPKPEIFASTATHYRMRAEFRVWHQGPKTFHIMFDQNSKEKYEVTQLPAACSLINSAMSRVITLVESEQELRTKLFQIDYLASTSHELVISLLYHKTLDDNWEKNAKSIVSSLSDLAKVSVIGRAKKQKVVIGNDFVNERLTIKGKQYEFKQIENSFTQPNAEMNIKMIEWVIDHTHSLDGDLLELYCGAGNFSIPLSDYFKNVLATEISKSSVLAAQHNIDVNRIENLSIVRLSSEEFTEAYKQTREFHRLKNISLKDYNFTTILVDPPRAGLDNETLKLVAQFDSVIYISCNPETLAANLVALDVTHKITESALFDQFPLTKHIESGVILRRR